MMATAGFFRLMPDLPKVFWRYPISYLNYMAWGLQVKFLSPKSYTINFFKIIHLVYYPTYNISSNKETIFEKYKLTRNISDFEILNFD